MALYLTESDVAAILTMDIALEEVERGFVHLAEGRAFNFPRNRLPNGRGAFNFMAATAPELGVMGMKTYDFVSNPSRFYVQLYDSATAELIALIEANGMGQVRTGAASGIATKYMARADASTVGMIGSGYQAGAQLEAVCRVRDITSARIYSRTRENRGASRLGHGAPARHRGPPRRQRPGVRRRRGRRQRHHHGCPARAAGRVARRRRARQRGRQQPLDEAGSRLRGRSPRQPARRRRRRRREDRVRRPHRVPSTAASRRGTTSATCPTW